MGGYLRPFIYRPYSAHHFFRELYILNCSLKWQMSFYMERDTRFELAPSAWKADMLAARHQSRIKNAGHYSGVKWAGRK